MAAAIEEMDAMAALARTRRRRPPELRLAPPTCSPPCPAVCRGDGGDGSEQHRVLDDGTCSRWSTSHLISLVVPAHLVLSRCYTDPRSGVPPSPPVLQRHNRAYEEDDRSWWRHTSLKFTRKMKIYVPLCYRPRKTVDRCKIGKLKLLV